MHAYCIHTDFSDPVVALTLEGAANEVLKLAFEIYDCQSDYTLMSIKETIMEAIDEECSAYFFVWDDHPRCEKIVVDIFPVVDRIMFKRA